MAPLHVPMRLLACAMLGFVTAEMRADDFPHYDLGTIPAWQDLASLRGARPVSQVLSKADYHHQLRALDIQQLYSAIATLMATSKPYWPADGPQDGDVASYAGLFARLAWHCSGSFRMINDTHAAGGCEGARQRHWPENEWRDNTNLDKARGLLAEVKLQFGDRVSWSDLMTFAGTVAIKASGGPAKKFCFGRLDDVSGDRSIPLGVEGVAQCYGSKFCKSNFECPNTFRWSEQNDTDHARCKIEQPDRLQASHSVGLIYVYPEGPELKTSAKDYKAYWVHNRSPRLSALEVRDTFRDRMGWTDRETVALIGGGHTLGRTHGNCNLTGTKWAQTPYNNVGPYFEAGFGKNTVSSGFEGPWTRSPSRWNYDFFDALLSEEWVPAKSPYGNDQWHTRNHTSEFAKTMRLTSDISLVADETYHKIVREYAADHAQFDADFADAWFKLVHRSEDHPHKDDLEQDAGICTSFEFVTQANFLP